MEDARRRLRRPILVALGALVAGSVFVALHLSRAVCRGRVAKTRASMAAVEAADEQYNRDFGLCPPGVTSGSRDLVAQLTTTGPRGVPYLESAAGCLTADGYLRNFVWSDPPRNRIFHELRDGRLRMWAMDCKGRPDGINNWER